MITALVAGVQAFLMSLRRGFSVSTSTSQNTGCAPQATMALAAPTKLMLGNITSWSELISKASMLANKPSVQVDTDCTRSGLTSICFAQACSNCLVMGPRPSQLLLNTA